jgi:hypothetical protein
MWPEPLDVHCAATVQVWLLGIRLPFMTRLALRTRPLLCARYSVYEHGSDQTENAGTIAWGYKNAQALSDRLSRWVA